MVLLSVFLFNLLCGLVPCDPSYRPPDINPSPFPQISFRIQGSPDPEVDNLIVKTTVGKVQGYSMKTIQGRDIIAFEGIPFGESTHFTRFKPPLPKRPWQGVRLAHKPGPYCTQYSLYKLFRVIGSEDCLYLNIFTPELPDKINNPKLPVIVYLHGGSYFMGSGSEYGPSYMLDENVVLVTINYRLGILGFLSTGDQVCSGNWGLKDQALALKWVNENIEYFGGDSKRVTLFGSSAGAASVHLHMISNVTRDYFQNGVSQSTTAFNHWSIQPRDLARKWTNKLARLVRCPTDDSQRLMDCIRQTNPDYLTTKTAQLFDWFPLPPVLFAPTIEHHESPDAFLTISPEEAYAKNLTAHKPWIATMTKEEGYTGIFVTRLLTRLHVLKNNWDKLLKYWLQFDYITDKPQEITDKITKFYIGNQNPRTISNDKLSEMATDRYFTFGISKGLQAHALLVPQSTYAYVFNFRGIHNLANIAGFTSKEWGIGHGEDGFYFFNSSYVYNGYKRDDPDYMISQLVINLIANFAAKGEPLYTNEDGDDRKIWDPVGNVTDMQFLQIDQHVKMVPQPYKDRLRFWQNLGLNDTVALVPL